MTGIICAMEVEAHTILSYMKNPVTEQISGIDFVSGTVCGKKAVVAVCGVGKVFAALCTQAMIMRFAPEIIINTGVGGTLTDRLHCGDIAVAASVVQHDMNTSPLGDPIGMISGINKINFVCDKSASADLKRIAGERLNIENVCGVIASGDRFINDRSEKQFIHRWFGAIACDMESGAVGQVCFVNGVPFCVLRSISDEADGRSHLDYSDFARIAANNAAKLLLTYLEETK